MFHLSLSSNLHLSIPLSDLPSPLLFHKQWTKSGQIKSPSSCYKLQTLIKQSVFFLNTTNKHQFPPSFLSFSLFPSLPLPFSRKHKTILSYPALAWENHKKNDKRPRKEAEKWCESESRAEVVKGESGQEGRRVRTRERETESARKGKERKGGSRWFWINKTWQTESGVAFRMKERKEIWQMDFGSRFEAFYYW